MNKLSKRTILPVLAIIATTAVSAQTDTASPKMVTITSAFKPSLQSAARLILLRQRR